MQAWPAPPYGGDRRQNALRRFRAKSLKSLLGLRLIFVLDVLLDAFCWSTPIVCDAMLASHSIFARRRKCCRMIACEDDGCDGVSLCSDRRISWTDSNPDYFQELKFLHRLLNIRSEDQSDSDGEQSKSVGNFSLVGTRSSSSPRCRHAVAPGRLISGCICY
jgi:hypothetical protein